MTSEQKMREVNERALVRTAPEWSVHAFFPVETQPDEPSVEEDALLLPPPPAIWHRRFVAPAWARFETALSIERERGVFFLLLPVFGSGGAIFYFSLAHEPGWLAILLSLALLGVLRVLARHYSQAAACFTLAMLFVLGMLTGKVETARFATQMLGSDITTRVTGRVASLEQEVDGGWRLTLDVLATERPTLRYMSSRIRVSARDLPAQTEIGSGLKGLVRLRAQSGPVRPGNYDFAFNGYFRGIGGNGFFLGTPQMADVAEAEGIGALASQWIARLRQKVGDRITAAISGEEGAVASALISGQRTGISEETNVALRQAGLAHVLSISGLHLALAAGVIMLSIRSVAAFFPDFSARHPIKKYAALASLFSSAFYLALSGADVAAQRSFVMIAVMLLALLADRAAISMRNLAIAALVTLVVSPHEILGPSFQMSFSATAALIAAFAWWSERKGEKMRLHKQTTFQKKGWVMKLLAPAGATAMTSLVAGIASGIYAAYQFNNTAPLGLLGNVMALPIISTMIMPFGVLALILMPLQLEWLPLQIMGAGVTGVHWVALFVSSLSPDGNPGILPVASVLLWTVALIIAVVCTTRLKLAALPFVVAGLIFFVRAENPDIMISEDARLVAVRMPDGSLAVNRSRPSRFTIENWIKAYKAEAILKPIMLKAGLHKNGATEGGAQVVSNEGFRCEEDVCWIKLADERMLAYTDKIEAVTNACNIGDIAVLAVAGTALNCSSAEVITKRDLALKGTLEMRLAAHIKPNEQKSVSTNTMSSAPEKPASEPLAPEHQIPKRVAVPTENQPADQLTYSIGPPERPWHQYRLYSRAARGLAERENFKKSSKQRPPPAVENADSGDAISSGE